MASPTITNTNTNTDTDTDMNANANTILKVDMSWRKFRAFITEHASADSAEKDNTTDPAYVVSFQSLKCPHILFKAGTSDNLIGSGTLKAFSINPDFEVHGYKSSFKAQRRLHMEYQHLSRAYASTAEPVVMTWKSKCGFTDWDFECTDEQGDVVARFFASAWRINKIGYIEFVGPKAMDRLAREEILVTGLSLYYAIMYRAGSILQLFGGVFSRPGPIKKEKKTPRDVDENTLVGDDAFEKEFQRNGLVLDQKEVQTQ